MMCRVDVKGKDSRRMRNLPGAATGETKSRRKETIDEAIVAEYGRVSGLEHRNRARRNRSPLIDMSMLWLSRASRRVVLLVEICGLDDVTELGRVWSCTVQLQRPIHEVANVTPLAHGRRSYCSATTD